MNDQVPVIPGFERVFWASCWSWRRLSLARNET